MAEPNLGDLIDGITEQFGEIPGRIVFYFVFYMLSALFIYILAAVPNTGGLGISIILLLDAAVPILDAVSSAKDTVQLFSPYR